MQQHRLTMMSVQSATGNSGLMTGRLAPIFPSTASYQEPGNRQYVAPQTTMAEIFSPNSTVYRTTDCPLTGISARRVPSRLPGRTRFANAAGTWRCLAKKVGIAVLLLWLSRTTSTRLVPKVRLDFVRSRSSPMWISPKWA